MTLKSALISLALIGGAFLAYISHPERMLAEELAPLTLESAIPSAFEEWTETNVGAATIVNPQTEALINSLYSQTLSRTYKSVHGDLVMLSIAYGKDQSDDKAVHYPEVCYPAQGLPIRTSETVTLRIQEVGTIPAKRLIAERGKNAIEPITYWAIVGDKATATGLQHKITQLQYGFKGIVPDGMIFRVSYISREKNSDFELLDNFLSDLAKNTDPKIRARIFGRGL